MLFLLFHQFNLACDTKSPVPPPEIQNASFQQEIPALINLWQRDQRDFTQVMSMHSEQEQLLVIREILRNPQLPHTPELCRSLPKSNQGYCEKMLSRSHLWDIAVTEKPLATSQKSIDTQCGTQDDWCLTQSAVKKVRKSQISEAKTICQSIQNTQGMEECHFQLAEELSLQGQPNNISTAFEICQKAPSYLEHCHNHIIEELAQSRNSKLTVEIVLEKLSTQQPYLQDYYLTLKALNTPSEDSLPNWDQHSAQTLLFLQWHHAQGNRKKDRSLKEWLNIFEQAPKEIFEQSLHLPYPIVSHWIQHGSRQLPSVYYLSLEKRPYSPDTAQDIKLAMVAALVQMEYPVEMIAQNELDSTIQWMLKRVPKKR